MESGEIIRSVNSIYDRFDIPSNLRMHMYRAAAVSEMICDSWKGSRLHRADIVATSLLHDLGNIVKMDFDTKLQEKMMGPTETKRFDHWKAVKEQVMEKYGPVDKEATINMLKELGVKEKIIEFISRENELFRSSKIEGPNAWGIEIFWYGDHRAGPFGIVSLQERIKDISIRYRDYLQRTFTKDQIRKRIGNIFIVERQIFQNATITPEQINDKTAESYVQKYKRSG